MFSAELFFKYLHSYGFSVSPLVDDPISIDSVSSQGEEKVDEIDGDKKSLDLLQRNIESLMQVFQKSMTTWYILSKLIYRRPDSYSIEDKCQIIFILIISLLDPTIIQA